MTDLILVSCVKKKRHEAAQAQDLYTSPLFRKMRNYAEKNSGNWAILSAKYGLILPDTMIEPYEKTLNKMRIGDRKVWSSIVFEKLFYNFPNLTSVTFLAGQKYREFLQKDLKAAGVRTSVPMEGMRLGTQLSWLSKQA